MAATRREIQEWWEQGQSRPERYLIVATDTFDYEDFPVYTDDPRQRVSELSDGLNLVMEVYDLDLPFRAGERVWDMPGSNE